MDCAGPLDEASSYCEAIETPSIFPQPRWEKMDGVSIALGSESRSCTSGTKMCVKLSMDTKN